jgi:hypothetical protein
METPKVKDPEQALGEMIATAITLHVDVDARRKLVFQTFLPRDASQGEHNAAVDKLMRTADRQETRCDLDGLKAKLKNDQRQLTQMKEDFRNIEVRATAAWQADPRKRGEAKLSAAEASAKVTAEANIKRYQDVTEQTQRDIAECEARLVELSKDG